MMSNPIPGDFTRFNDEEKALLEALHRWYTVSFPPMQAFFQSEFRAMVYLVERQEAAPSDLADLLGVTRQRVTTLLNGLRGKGFVAMEADESDRRRMRVRLTEAGRRHFIEQSSALSGSLDYVFARLGRDGVRQMIDILNKILPEEADKQ